MPVPAARKRKDKEKATSQRARDEGNGVVDASQGDSSVTEELSSSSRSALTECACRCLHSLKWLLFLLVLPAILNHASLYKEAEHLKPEGELVSVGPTDHKMFISCTGEGKPTVVLDAPTGMSSDVWCLVQPRIAKLTRVCSYDRTGIGFSSSYLHQRPGFDDSPPGPMSSDVASMLTKGQESTTERMVEDLHTLIHSNQSYSGLPYIVVGSELGALNAMFYAQMFESEVSDIVLIDPLVDGMFEIDDAIWEQFWYGHLVPTLQSLQLSAAIGLTRLGLMLGLVEQPIKGEVISETVQARQKHLMCLPRHLKAAVEEHFFANQSLSQMKTAYTVKPFPQNVSVTVITGNYYDEELPSPLNKVWAKATQRLVSSVHPSAKHLLINGADHHMLYRNPNAIVEPIKKLIRHWRQRNNKMAKGT
ncbi:uncharacterized protein [Diadema setosum]|uniref:uncharacterized protein n=1 Tax=Diadema setosum TaxID=31175 RepID=UPI003B3AED48